MHDLTLKYFDGKHGFILDISHNLIGDKHPNPVGTLQIYIVYLIVMDSEQGRQLLEYFIPSDLIEVYGVEHCRAWRAEIHG